jgi:hypothetical protein
VEDYCGHALGYIHPQSPSDPKPGQGEFKLGVYLLHDSFVKDDWERGESHQAPGGAPGGLESYNVKSTTRGLNGPKRGTRRIHMSRKSHSWVCVLREEKGERTVRGGSKEEMSGEAQAPWGDYGSFPVLWARVEVKNVEQPRGIETGMGRTRTRVGWHQGQHEGYDEGAFDSMM